LKRNYLILLGGLKTCFVTTQDELFYDGSKMSTQT